MRFCKKKNKQEFGANSEIFAYGKYAGTGGDFKIPL